MLFRRLWWTASLAWHALGQRRYAFKPLAAIRRDQSRRVRRAVTYACRHVPYYRETLKRLGLSPADFTTADDLANLPVLERDQVARDPEYFVADNARLDRCLRQSSSGSAGKPISLAIAPSSQIEYLACGERLRAVLTGLIGARRGYREASIASPTGNTRSAQRYWRGLTLLPRRVVADHLFLSLWDPIEENVEKLAALRPRILYTYGSALAQFFSHLHATGYRGPLPDLAVYGADMLPAEARRLIEQHFRVPVLSAYQAIEAPRLAFQCEQRGGLHVNVDAFHVRIADAGGRTLPPGESGEVVVSNLVNRPTVLLNYRLGDIAALLPEPCPCGRSLPLLSLLEGRSDDLLLDTSGQSVRPHGPRDVIAKLPGIWQYQVVQEDLRTFTVSLVAAPSCDRKDVAQCIRTRLADLCGDDIATDVRFVESIPTTAAGKVRPIVCKCRS